MLWVLLCRSYHQVKDVGTTTVRTTGSTQPNDHAAVAATATAAATNDCTNPATPAGTADGNAHRPDAADTAAATSPANAADHATTDAVSPANATDRGTTDATTSADATVTNAGSSSEHNPSSESSVAVLAHSCLPGPDCCAYFVGW